jgi:flagellar hook-associated protein FlgK
MINLINYENTFMANLRVLQTWDDTVGNIVDVVG